MFARPLAWSVVVLTLVALVFGCARRPVANAPLDSDKQSGGGDCEFRTSGSTVTIPVSDGRNTSLVCTLTEGEAIFEGDIVIATASDLGRIRIQGIGITGSEYRWPDKTVPYTIDRSLPNAERVHSAIAHWQSKTQIRFVSRNTEKDYVTFRPGSGCNSQVGRRGGQQFITIGSDCATGNVIHEIGHAVGLWHEQSREDRDNFVTVMWDNVATGRDHNFKQHVTDADDVGQYDYDSIMHYPKDAFAKDPEKPTLVPKPETREIGQRRGLSSSDVASVKVLYP